jgi:hypothetical protein
MKAFGMISAALAVVVLALAACSPGREQARVPTTVPPPTSAGAPSLALSEILAARPDAPLELRIHDEKVRGDQAWISAGFVYADRTLEREVLMRLEDGRWRLAHIGDAAPLDDPGADL